MRAEIDSSGDHMLPVSETHLVKVVFPLGPSEVHEDESEFMLAESVGPDP